MRNDEKIILSIISLLIIISSSAFSQFGGNSDQVKIKSYSSFDKIYPGSEFKVALKVDVAETWHINSDKPKEDFLIPTELTLGDIKGFKLIKKAYPEAKEYKFNFSETPSFCLGRLNFISVPS